MIRRPPRSTRTDTLFPYTTLFRSHGGVRRGFLGGRSAVWRLRDPDGLETAFALPIGESFDGGRQHPDRPGRFGMVGRHSIVLRRIIAHARIVHHVPAGHVRRPLPVGPRRPAARTDEPTFELQ